MFCTQLTFSALGAVATRSQGCGHVPGEVISAVRAAAAGFSADSGIFSKGLILAQNERWRRGLGMQVERSSAMVGAANGVVMDRNVPSGRG